MITRENNLFPIYYFKNTSLIYYAVYNYERS